MNLRDLTYLLAVAERRHFGRAAEACHITQPTLSAQIRKLEAWLGVAIFERTNKSVVPTAVGEEILHHARLAVEQARQIETIAHARRDPLTAPLRLGVIPTLGPYLLPLVLRPMKRAHPGLQLIVSEERTATLIGRLHRHEIDAALVATNEANDKLGSIPLFEEPFLLATPPNHALARRKRISDADLAGADLLLLADGHCLRDQVLAVCGGAGTAMGDLRAASLEMLLQLVAAGDGCTLVPALAALQGGPARRAGVALRSLDLPRARRCVALLFRHTFPRRPALDALTAVIERALPPEVTPIPHPQS